MFFSSFLFFFFIARNMRDSAEAWEKIDAEQFDIVRVENSNVTSHLTLNARKRL